jgi:hypothetical protein
MSFDARCVPRIGDATESTARRWKESGSDRQGLRRPCQRDSGHARAKRSAPMQQALPSDVAVIPADHQAFVLDPYLLEAAALRGVEGARGRDGKALGTAPIHRVSEPATGYRCPRLGRLGSHAAWYEPVRSACGRPRMAGRTANLREVGMGDILRPAAGVVQR